MNRRKFLAASALASLAPDLSRSLLIAGPRPLDPRSGSKMPLLQSLVTTPVVGFPTVTPMFAAMFTPGAGGIQFVQSDNWADFTTQTATMSNNGYILSCMTTIQNLNRTWYYGAYQKGSGKYQLFQATSATAFQQMFTELQSGYRLVDFNITRQQGQLLYSGYWLATSAPPRKH
jgi:hypothetical protein